MSDTSTSLRDPIFYRYHRFIDNIFQEYKATLPVYEQKDVSCILIALHAIDWTASHS